MNTDGLIYGSMPVCPLFKLSSTSQGREGVARQGARLFFNMM